MTKWMREFFSQITILEALIVVAIIAIILAITLSACSGKPEASGHAAERAPVAEDVTRFVDDEAGVVCFVYSRPYRSGISCIPISQTKLEAK